MTKPRTLLTDEEKNRISQKKYNGRPEVKAKRKEYNKEYRSRPEVKAKRKEDGVRLKAYREAYKKRIFEEYYKKYFGKGGDKI